MDKYKTFYRISREWGIPIRSREDIFPPCDVTTSQVTVGICKERTGSDTFFSHGYKTRFGQDFGDWYQGSLLVHSAKLAQAAHKHFDLIFGVPIAMKVAGIHWKHFDPIEPMSAARAAGYWDYAALLRSFKHQNLEVTFTAIEMDDEPTSSNHSGAKALANHFFNLCKVLKAKCGSENALSVHNVRGYQNMREILSKNPILSLTLLRHDDLINNIANTQAYANYVVAVRGNVLSLFFKVKLPLATQRVSIVGSIPELAPGFALTRFQCSSTECEWIGNLVYSRPSLGQGIYFRVMTLTNGQKLVQCDAYSIVQNTQSANVFVNFGAKNVYLFDKIKNVNFTGLQLCPETTIPARK